MSHILHWFELLSKITRGFIAQPRELYFAGVSPPSPLISLQLNRTTFFLTTSAFLAFVGAFVRTRRAFKAFVSAASFFFCACFSAFSSTLTSSILSFLAAACRAFSTFSASAFCFLAAVSAFLVSIRSLSDFANASFSANLSCARRTFSAENSIGPVCSSPNTLSRFPRTLLFFSSFSASISPTVVHRSSAACAASSSLALKSFSSFSCGIFIIVNLEVLDQFRRSRSL